MSDEPTYRATIRREDPLGRPMGSGEITGYGEYVLDHLRLQLAVLSDLHPGDSLVVAVAVDVPVDHPLAGIDLRG